MKREIKHRWWILAVVTVAGFLVDWWTKMAAVAHLTPGHPVPVVSNYFQLVLLYNKAALFGLDPRHLFPGFPVNAVFSVFTCVAIVALVVYYKCLKKEEILMHWGLVVVLPGAIGNLFDRLVFPGRGVVDFLMVDLRVWPFNPWPVFNMADVYVTVGVGFLVAAMIFDDQRGNKAPSTAPGDTPHEK